MKSNDIYLLDFEQFATRMRLQYIFHGNLKGKHPFHVKSSWIPVGVARIFQRGGGGSHCVKQRVLAFSQPEYCRLFALKKGLQRGGGGGGVMGTPGPP